MPTYDYICENCGHEFEQFQMITAKPIRKCPRCGREGVKRLIGVGAGIIFRGSGFYETDYRSESYKKAADKEKLVRAEPAGARSPTSKDSDKKETKAENKETKSSEKPEAGTKHQRKSS